MAKKQKRSRTAGSVNGARVSSNVDDLMLAALQRGDDTLETGRLLVTFKEGAAEEGMQSFGSKSLRVANARDFTDQAAVLDEVGDADAIVFPEIGVALVGSDSASEAGIALQAETAADSPIESIDPEYFVFAENGRAPYLESAPQAAERSVDDFLRGFIRATEAILQEVRERGRPVLEAEEEALVLGATWGLVACKVPPSLRSGVGIKVAVLDTGFDLGHPDFVGRAVMSAQFVGQPVQDLHGHGTHCIGTACGPKSPAGSTPRYGIGHRTTIVVGKVLSNSGFSVGGSVLNGMNWAIAARCPVISMSLGSQVGPQPAYTNAGQAALNNGCLIVAAAGNSNGAPTGAPANSPTIMAVASLDSNLAPSSFSNAGKIEIAAPGRDVFSSWPRPTRYRTISGTSMATPHVAGCAALWAETSPNLRGINLWRRLQASAKRLPFPATKVGAGLVQAP
jgi:subtilisin family serine protease